MVIQRWQSVLLFIASMVMFVFSFLPIGQIKLPDHTLIFSVTGFRIDNPSSDYFMHTWTFLIVSLMCAILPLINLFLFRNLQLQKKLCAIEMIFIVTAVSLGCYYGYHSFENGTLDWSYPIVAPVVALISTIIAYIRINSDQRLLRSVDRIR